MGIVASLAAIPVAEDIIRDERRRELQRLEEERLRRLRESGYRYGDLDLQLIKRYEEDIVLETHPKNIIYNFALNPKTIK